MIYIICKILVLFKNHMNFLNDNIFECFFKKYNKLLSLEKKVFFIVYNDRKSKARRRNRN